MTFNLTISTVLQVELGFVESLKEIFKVIKIIVDIVINTKSIGLDFLVDEPMLFFLKRCKLLCLEDD